MRSIRPLGAAATLAVSLLALVGLEIGVSTLYDPPAPMLDKAADYNAVPHGTTEEVLIFGTCLPEQIIQTQALGEQLDATVYNLATPAGTSRLFYLTLLHHIPEDARIKAIVVPYGRGDLTKLMAPYESQVMELAEWSDMPDLIAWSCQDSGCAVEMMLRKGSRGYRYRGYLANRFWQGLGTKEPIPGYVLSPGAVEPPKMDEGGSPPPNASQNTGDGAPQGKGGGGSEFKPTGPGADQQYVHLEQFLALAAHRGIPVVFIPLPERSQLDERSSGRAPDQDQGLYDVIEQGGGVQVDVYALPGLSTQHFEDEVHLRPEGRILVTQAIGQALSERWSGGP